MIGVFYTIDSHERAEVYSILLDGITAFAFFPSRVSDTGKGGWCKVLLKSLIPEEYANKYIAGFHSKSEMNKVKQRVKIATAIWVCTDGARYDHTEYDMAVAHEWDLYLKENQNVEEYSTD